MIVICPTPNVYPFSIYIPNQFIPPFSPPTPCLPLPPLPYHGHLCSGPGTTASKMYRFLELYSFFANVLISISKGDTIVGNESASVQGHAEANGCKEVHTDMWWMHMDTYRCTLMHRDVNECLTMHTILLGHS